MDPSLEMLTGKLEEPPGILALTSKSSIELSAAAITSNVVHLVPKP
eukprot:CAMPEP_0116856586 /NCGR_PEP_ID=MMETSP0418-20121206/20006_1 /TAXON_ID=1158023 /ORGANISM="Astrosyne radiata, Strain 13vi08-1A" /LENGTH=45 /DNA_ID= /DNA_START= /DNA_END= /DNA_ORIENTATION=